MAIFPFGGTEFLGGATRLSSVLQRVAVCCSVLQSVAGCCRVLQGGIEGSSPLSYRPISANEPSE